MKETSKAMKRRFADATFPWREVFKGEGIDVGSGDDPLAFAHAFNLPDGGGDDLRSHFSKEDFDFIHGSQVLEHMTNPYVALCSWIRLLKPGGYIIATVPDFVAYEHCCWPSKFNAGHQSTWSMLYRGSPAAIHIHIPSWLEKFKDVAEVKRACFVDTNYNYALLGRDLDQTFNEHDGVECFNEFVLQKR